jgi:hypothetical protein
MEWDCVLALVTTTAVAIAAVSGAVHTHRAARRRRQQVQEIERRVERLERLQGRPPLDPPQ